jgi:hypothetical protein
MAGLSHLGDRLVCGSRWSMPEGTRGVSGNAGEPGRTPAGRLWSW